MARTINHHHRITAKARVRSQASPCGTYDGQSGTAIGFSHGVSVFPLRNIPCSYFIHDRRYIILETDSEYT